MSEWKNDVLANHAYLITKGTTPTSLGRAFQENGINFIKAESITDDGKFIPTSFAYIDEETHELLKRSQLHSGDILFSIAGVLGRVAIVNDEILPANTNQALALIRLFNISEIEKEFLMYFLKSEFIKEQIRRINVQAAQANFSLGDINRLKIQYPSEIIVQRKIAHILTTCDTVIEQTQSAIVKYKAIKQGLLHDLFTRGLDATGKLRPNYQQAPELYKESELGMIPKEWEVKRLGDVIDAIDPQPDHRTPESVENGIPYLGINDIDSFGNIDLRKCRKVSTVILEEHKRRYKIRNGDIIFGKIGTIGEPKRLNNFNNLTLSANVILIQPRRNTDYIYWYLLSESVNKQINNSIHTTSQPAFGMDKIRSLIIPMCDRIEQSEIAKRMNSIDNKIQTEETLLQKYQSIKRGLMGDLLGGRKEV